MVSCIYTRRGLMRCLSFAKAMRRPDGGISEYKNPTSFLFIYGIGRLQGILIGESL